MDYFHTQLKDVFNNKNLSDTELILIDSTHQVSIQVHRLILYLSCPFFKKMFVNFQESLNNKIELNVIDCEVVMDIIASFYGVNPNVSNPEWRYKLNHYRCCDYFGIECEIPTNIKIPNEHFEELLDIVEMIGYNESTVKIIANNIPENYDIDKFPKDLLEFINSELYDVDIHMIVPTLGNVNIVKICLNYDVVDIHSIYVSYMNKLWWIKDMNKIITYNNSLKFYDIDSGTIQCVTKIVVDYMDKLLYNTHNKQLILMRPSKLEIYDAVTVKLIKEIIMFKNISQKMYKILNFNCAINSNYIIYIKHKYIEMFLENYSVNLYNTITDEHTILYGSDHEIGDVCLSPDDKYMLFAQLTSSKNTYQILKYNIEESTTILFDFTIENIKYLCYSPNGKYIGIINDETISIICAEKNIIISEIEFDCCKIFFLDDDKIISCGRGHQLNVWNFKGDLLKSFKDIKGTFCMHHISLVPNSNHTIKNRIKNILKQ
ncbi:putative BTB/POZ domain-containing protein [Cotonvirus japonicus]|uniref:BTB/POZ domain-containing protein n=1 Tax=Cotonvirus japonicus TaxID=2811091 RepID=A0ABM7NR88_9VIRU|nr:putative BTB/POZ domain-containing protein [Cotonvirus japonicus]BCS82675.1 putative BTB/POZ domain-containing protein [Cotonvirus japonicus]